jgi:hypothetical protein
MDRGSADERVNVGETRTVMSMLMENRRRIPRSSRRLAVHVIDADGDFSVTSGETVDIGPGGLRVALSKALGAGASEVLVQVELPTGSQVISNARIVDAATEGDRHTYRLVFLDLALDDAAALLWVTLPTGW